MSRITLMIATLLLTACAQTVVSRSNTSATPLPDAAIYEAAVANSARPEADRARDAGRKPAEVLRFVGIAPGMTVLDMFAGGGYYTEIIATIVGENGRVIAHSNAAYRAFAGDQFERRFGNDRLPNTEILMAENNALELEPASLDAVMLVLSYHDLYYVAPDQGWPQFDVPKFLAELRRGLKPGGRIGIVDHYAAAGSPAATGNTTHRIDPANVIAEMRAAGFELDAQSDILRNRDDNYAKNVFDPDLRGKTDRFVLRFTKAD